MRYDVGAGEAPYDIVAIGECLFDLVETEGEGTDAPVFCAKAGGAPANVLAMAVKLGGRCAFIGKAGYDSFGMRLREAYDRAGIDTRGMLLDARYPTTLAFVQLDKRGERAFSFYRDHGADTMLCVEEVPENMVENTRIMHFGSVSLTREPCRAATVSAVRRAKASGALISYDPNYRPLLWEDEGTAVHEMRSRLPLTDIVKVSEEEMVLLTGTEDVSLGSLRLAEQGPVLVFVTLGETGAVYRRGDLCGYIPAYTVNTVDTTGAGDAFMGAVLRQLSGMGREDLTRLSEEELAAMTRFACAAGALVTTAHGAIPAMPSREEIRHLTENG